jgi:ribosomal-protein-alanine N-acetyltransferase
MIRTSRLYLRDFAISDYEAVHAYAADPLVTRYTSFGPNSREDTESFLAMAADEVNAAPRRNFSFAVIHAETNRLIGSGGIVMSEPTGPQFTFGYVLHRDCWQQGFGTELAAGLLRFGFDELQAHRMWAHVFVGNTVSARILESLGLRLEGCARQALFARQSWHDAFTYAMLSSEWLSRRQDEHAS